MGTQSPTEDQGLHPNTDNIPRFVFYTDRGTSKGTPSLLIDGKL